MGLRRWLAIPLRYLAYCRRCNRNLAETAGFIRRPAGLILLGGGPGVTLARSFWDKRIAVTGSWPVAGLPGFFRTTFSFTTA
jgi:hypothetical protein